MARYDRRQEEQARLAARRERRAAIAAEYRSRRDGHLVREPIAEYASVDDPTMLDPRKGFGSAPRQHAPAATTPVPRLKPMPTAEQKAAVALENQQRQEARQRAAAQDAKRLAELSARNNRGVRYAAPEGGATTRYNAASDIANDPNIVGEGEAETAAVMAEWEAMKRQKAEQHAASMNARRKQLDDQLAKRKAEIKKSAAARRPHPPLPISRPDFMVPPGVDTASTEPYAPRIINPDLIESRRRKSLAGDNKPQYGRRFRPEDTADYLANRAAPVRPPVPDSEVPDFIRDAPPEIQREFSRLTPEQREEFIRQWEASRVRRELVF